MSILSVIIYALVVLIAILLIALILVQPSKSGGFGSAFGGVGESVFGAQAMSHLSKLTVILITCFFVLTLLLAVVTGHMSSGQKSVMENAEQVSEKQTSAMTETAAAPAEEKSAEKTAAPVDVPAK